MSTLGRIKSRKMINSISKIKKRDKKSFSILKNEQSANNNYQITEKTKLLKVTKPQIK